MAYAEDTSVPVSQTRQEVERMLKGAGARKFYIGEMDDADVARCKSKQGQRLTDTERELIDAAWESDPTRYSSLEPDVFNATAPFGSTRRA